jgi:hypothetical protein
VPIVAIFRHPTIRDLAAHLDEAGGEPGAAPSPAARSFYLDEARARAEARRARGARRR